MHGKMMIVSFDGSEDSVFKKIYTTLMEDANIQPLWCEDYSEVSCGELKINRKEQKIKIGEKEIFLNRYEFYTLLYLASHRGWIFSKEQIYEAVWKTSGEMCGAAVANVISQLRKKLREIDAEKEYIQTVVNSGYRFIG